jgi:hypothetical protein
MFGALFLEVGMIVRTTTSIYSMWKYMCVCASSATTGDVDLPSPANHKTVNISPVAIRKNRSHLCRFKTRWWQEVLWQDRVTVAYLTYQIVTEILTKCNNIAEQNHNHCTLENLFRLD